jgi:TonB family protein
VVHPDSLGMRLRFAIFILWTGATLLAAGLWAQAPQNQQYTPAEFIKICSEKNSQPCATPPRVIDSPMPEYSEQARKVGLQGTCTLLVVVEADGHASHIRVIKSLGMGLDEKAIEAVKRWKFKPALKDGNPVPVQIAIAVAFHFHS